jgi:large subunit ribosomal protein L6
MSRVGKMPVAVPQGVEVALTAEQISVKGAQGTLSRPVHRLVKVASENGQLSFVPVDESAEANAMSGTIPSCGEGHAGRYQGRMPDPDGNPHQGC